MSTPVVGTPEPDHSGFGTRQQMRGEIVALEARLVALEEALRRIEQCEWQEATVPDLVAIARAALSRSQAQEADRG